MAGKFYVGVSNKAKELWHAYIGNSSNKANTVVKAYVGNASNKAQLVYELKAMRRCWLVINILCKSTSGSYGNSNMAYTIKVTPHILEPSDNNDYKAEFFNNTSLTLKLTLKNGSGSGKTETKTIKLWQQDNAFSTDATGTYDRSTGSSSESGNTATTYSYTYSGLSANFTSPLVKAEFTGTYQDIDGNTKTVAATAITSSATTATNYTTTKLDIPIYYRNFGYIK